MHIFVLINICPGDFISSELSNGVKIKQNVIEGHCDPLVCLSSVQFSSVTQSVTSNSLWPHGLQHISYMIHQLCVHLNTKNICERLMNLCQNESSTMPHPPGNMVNFRSSHVLMVVSRVLNKINAVNGASNFSLLIDWSKCQVLFQALFIH